MPWWTYSIHSVMYLPFRISFESMLCSSKQHCSQLFLDVSWTRNTSWIIRIHTKLKSTRHQTFVHLRFTVTINTCIVVTIRLVWLWIHTGYTFFLTLNSQSPYLYKGTSFTMCWICMHICTLHCLHGSFLRGTCMHGIHAWAAHFFCGTCIVYIYSSTELKNSNTRSNIQ